MRSAKFTAAAIMAAAVLVSAGLAAPVASAAEANVLTARTSSCGKPLTVYSPADARKPFLPASAARSAGTRAIVAKAQQRHARWLSTFTCRSHPGRRHPVKPAASTANAASTNWSGYVAEVNAPIDARATWTVPEVFSTSVLGYSSIWPGVGGYTDVGAGELIQDGTEQDSWCDSGGCGVDSYFWFEVYPDEPEQEVTNMTATPDDSVTADAAWDPSVGAEFTLCNWTTNICGTASQSAGAPGPSAEWIVERPTIDGDLPPLAKFGTVSLTDSSWYSTDLPAGAPNQTIAQGDGQAIDMDNGETQLDRTNGLGDDGASFSVDWLNSW